MEEMRNKKVMLYICWFYFFFFFFFFSLAFLHKRIHKTVIMHVFTACHLCDFDLKMHLATGIFNHIFTRINNNIYPLERDATPFALLTLTDLLQFVCPVEWCCNWILPSTREVVLSFNYNIECFSFVVILITVTQELGIEKMPIAQYEDYLHMLQKNHCIVNLLCYSWHVTSMFQSC